MIRAVFREAPGGFSAVTLSGHAGYAAAGEDICCAAVTSAFQMCANGVTEILGDAADVNAGGDEAGIALREHPRDASRAFLAALHLHLSLLREDYPKHIEIIISEV